MGWDSAAAAARSGWRVHSDAQSGLTNDTSGWSTSAGGSGAQASQSQSQGGVSGRRDWQFQQSNDAWNAGGEYGRSNDRGGNGRGRYSNQGRAPPPHIQRAGEGGYDRPPRQHNGNGNGEGGDRRPRREDRVDMGGDGVSDQGGWGKTDGGGGGNGGGGGGGEDFGGRCGFSGRGRRRGRGRGSFGGDGSGRGGDGYSTARNHRGGGYVGGGGDGYGALQCDNGDDYGGGYGAEIPRPGYGGRGMSSGYDSRRRPPMRDSGPYMADLAPIDFSRVELPPFQKDFYTEHKNVTSRSDSEIEEWRKFKKITVVGKAPRPAHNWVEAMLPDFVLEYIKKKGFLEPTAIQSQGFPMALSGNDLVAISETGSGKTLTYAAPGILHVQAQPPTDAASGPIALVMAPTRELAMQIRAEFRAIGEGSPVTSACAYGGASKMRQLADIANGVDILVATPGRLLEYLAEGSVTLKRVTYLVVDEADRMIHEGFEEELRQIFSCVRPDRQVLMFSATWPEEVRDLAQEFLKDAARVHIGKDEIVAAKNIKQEVVICHGYMDKRDKLVQILEDVKAQRGKIIVFLNTKRSVQEMTDWLRDKPNNYEALCLHGDKRQEERDFALNEFRKGGHPILLATDVAQRGLDIPDVTTVCNFDVPDNVASYVHRIGRTARAGREGRSFTLVSGSRDRAMAAEIVQVMQRDEQIIPEELEEYAREDALFAPIETSTPFTDTLAASTSNEAAPAAWGSASSASTSSRGVPAAKSDEASTGAGWGPSDVKGDEASGPSSEQTPKPWGKTANEVQKDEDSSAAGYDSGYGGSSPETSPAKSTTWGRSSSLLSPTELDHNVVESHTLETADEEVRPEDFLAKMVAPGDADSDGGSGTITPTEAAKLEADLDKVSLDDDA